MLVFEMDSASSTINCDIFLAHVNVITLHFLIIANATVLNISSPTSSGRTIPSLTFKPFKEVNLSLLLGLEILNLLLLFAILISKLVNPTVHSQFSNWKGIPKEKFSLDFVKVISKAASVFVWVCWILVPVFSVMKKKKP